jgi:Ca-activated chloride channel homolog
MRKLVLLQSSIVFVTLLVFVASAVGQQNDAPTTVTPQAPQTSIPTNTQSTPANTQSVPANTQATPANTQPNPANTQTALPGAATQTPVTQGPPPNAQNSPGSQGAPSTQNQPSTQASPGTQGSPSPQGSPDVQGAPSNDQGMFVFKKQVEEVVLHATVVDERRHLETHLDRGAFTVFEDGRPQNITAFRRDDVPVAIGIVIDNSGSMRAKREQVNQAVLNLIRASNPQDEVFVVNFSQNPYLDQDFTSDINLLERALNKTSMQGSTALYDAVVAAAAHLKSNPRFDKKILLVITDGKDNMSRETLQEAMRHLQEKNGPVLYAIGLMGTGVQGSGQEALQKLADATGGSAYFPDSLDQVSDITRSLAHDIRSQYTISYKPQSRGLSSGSQPISAYHPIVVEARAPGYGRLTVRTRNGYYTGESVR